MHLGRLLIATAAFVVFAAPAAVVYKWTDANGVVHYSDQPGPGAETIVTAGPQQNGISTGSRGPLGSPSRNFSDSSAASSAVTSLTIESPANEQVFFNDDVVSVRLRVEPPLQSTQSVSWSLNGRTLTDQAPQALSFALQSLPRGTYVIAATLTDSATGASQSAQSVTFYVRQPSELSPQHKQH
jgi:hypothetical protein